MEKPFVCLACDAEYDQHRGACSECSSQDVVMAEPNKTDCHRCGKPATCFVGCQSCDECKAEDDAYVDFMIEQSNAFAAEAHNEPY